MGEDGGDGRVQHVEEALGLAEGVGAQERVAALGAFVAHQAFRSAAMASCGCQRKTGRPKVHSEMKAWQRTGSHGSERPSGVVL
jgi:hypothetical protein